MIRYCFFLVLALLGLNATSSPATAQSLDNSNGFANSTGITRNGSAVVAGSVLRLTGGNLSEEGSAYSSSKVNVASFHNHFQFQILPSIHGAESVMADGITFTIQNVGPSAWYSGGGGLGVGPDHHSENTPPGLPTSVTIKFDVYNNEGEGFSSTGLYLNGVPPTIPAIDLIPSNIDLQSYHLFDVTMDYNGSLLMVTIEDTKTGASATQSYNVDIPAVVGGTTAYVGFTGTMGAVGAMQSVLCWDWNRTATRVVRVSTTGNDANDGSSWATAVRTIQRGLNLAGAGGPSAEVWVAGGSYLEHVTVPAGVSLLGGFSGSETQRTDRNWTANVTTIDGSGTGWAVNNLVGRPTRVDGFTIRNSQRAIVTFNCATFVANCTITNNGFNEWGAGVMGDNSSPIVCNSTISGNSTLGDGAAIDVAVVTPGAICVPYITQNLIDNNRSIRRADGYGGYGPGIVFWQTRDVVVACNDFRNNVAEWVSGAVNIYNAGAGGATVVGNTFDGNTTRYGAGAIDFYAVSYVCFKDNLLTHNNGTEGSGGVAIAYSPKVRVVANTLEDNRARYEGAGYIGDAPDILVQNNRFHANRSELTSGGMGCYRAGGSIQWNSFWDNFGQYGAGMRVADTSIAIRNNYFVGNQSSSNSGGLEVVNCGSSIANNQFDGNRGGWGGAAGIWSSTASFINNTVVYNGADHFSGLNVVDSNTEIANNILAFNDNTAITAFGGMGGVGPNIHQNLFYGNLNGDIVGAATGPANLSFDPLFVNPAVGDFRLQTWSMAIDAGQNSLAVGTSLDGNWRILNGTVDLGAFEFAGAPDREPPLTTATVDPQPNVAGWNYNDVFVTLFAVDASRVENIRYRVGGGAWVEVAEATVAFPVTGEGIHTIEFQATDGLNVEAVKSLAVKIDKTPPIVSVTPDQSPKNGWYRAGVTFTTSATDALSGVGNVDSPRTYSDGQYPEQMFNAQDVAGNGAFTTVFLIRVDGLAPVTTATPNGPGKRGWFTGDTTVTLSATDNASGVSETLWRVNGGPERTYISPFTFSNEGIYVIDYWSVDKAGNAETHKTISVGIDKTPPVTSIDMPASDGGNGTLSASDNLSGVWFSFYRRDSGLTIPYTGVVDVSGEGFHTISYWSEDNAGNVEAEKTFSLFLVKPKAPTTLTATQNPGSSAVTLKWTDNATTETDYRLVRSDDGGATFNYWNWLPRDATSFVDTSAKYGVTYTYRVFALNNAGNSGKATTTISVVQPPPAAPSNLSAELVPGAGPTVKLTWKDNSNDETGFTIEKSVNDGTFTAYTQVGADTTSVTLTNLQPGTKHTFRIFAMRSGIVSAKSNTASVTIPAAPAAPTNLAASVGSNGLVTLTWTDNATNEEGVEIGFSFDNGKTWQTYKLSGVDITRTVLGYYSRYRIRAYNIWGYSAYAGPVSPK